MRFFWDFWDFFEDLWDFWDFFLPFFIVHRWDFWEFFEISEIFSRFLRLLRFFQDVWDLTDFFKDFRDFFKDFLFETFFWDFFDFWDFFWDFWDFWDLFWNFWDFLGSEKDFFDLFAPRQILHLFYYLPKDGSGFDISTFRHMRSKPLWKRRSLSFQWTWHWVRMRWHLQGEVLWKWVFFSCFLFFSYLDFLFHFIFILIFYLVRSIFLYILYMGTSYFWEKLHQSQDIWVVCILTSLFGCQIKICIPVIRVVGKPIFSFEFSTPYLWCVPSSGSKNITMTANHTGWSNKNSTYLDIIWKFFHIDLGGVWVLITLYKLNKLKNSDYHVCAISM